MKKVTTLVVVSLFLLTSLAFAQESNWEFDKLLYDFQLPQDNGWGVHGVAVAPDGNIWMALHGGLHDEVIETAAGDTIGFYRPLYILDPDGNHVSFSPLKVLEFADGTLDTLHTNSPINGSGKGISVDNDGNILYTSWSTVYRIDYQTGMGLNAFTPDDMTSMTEAVQDDNGNIYVGYVVSASRPIFILDNDFNLIGNAVDTLGYINRSIAVSPDGKDLYTGSTWNGFGIAHYHSDIPGVLAFEPVDTLGNWAEVYDAEKDTTYLDVKLWASCIDWGPDGNLWAGNLRPDWSGPKGGMYYAFDVTTGEIVDRAGIPLGDSTAGGTYSPRGAAWSADGNTMYLADFDYNTVGVWKRVEKPTGPWTNTLETDFEYAGVFADETVLNSGHGITVDNSDRVWIGSYRPTDPGGLVILNADGTPASISPIGSVEFADTTFDLTATNCRGMATDHEGNILYCNVSTLIRINAETGAGMNYYVGGGSLVKPGVDENGNIYVGTVVGVTPVIMLDPDFNVIMEINLDPHAGYARGIAVSSDGKDIYSGNLSAGGPVYIYHSDIPGVTDYAFSDSIYINTDGDKVFSYQCVTIDIGPDGNLWVSNDDSYAAGGQADNACVIVDVATKEYTYLNIPMDSTEYNGPRGVAFSSDGNIAYVTSFTASRVYKFVRNGAGVADGDNMNTPSQYELSQNYPNPFNPTTTIQFTIPNNEFVALKVYNSRGQVVKSLINELKTAGRHEVIFNASNFASGVYYYRLKVNETIITKSMLLVK
ncbi:T9SS type A sorting domain-containing protein [candidate division KSB1 bacterium]|nr:T9SS type A sorting domain-containing protein [candidate division KSB1 bacterium]MBL7095322.1 T9SS type A sorting domain-containing protein [candidate division KSB1 bacterium]